MTRPRSDRGWTIYDALLALVLCGLLLVSLTCAAISAAAASESSRNRLFALSLMQSEIAKHRLKPEALVAHPVAIDITSQSSRFTGNITSLSVPGVPKLYQITAKIGWNDRAKPREIQKSFLVFSRQ